MGNTNLARTSWKRAAHCVISLAVLACVYICGLIPVSAQCSMCKAVVSNAAGNGSLVRGLDLGIVALLIPPVLIFCAIFGVALAKDRESITCASRDRRNDATEEAGLHLSHGD